MSTFLKTPPNYTSTSYGMYGTTNVNPYASYFGPHQQSQSQQPPPANPSTSSIPGITSYQSPQNSSFAAPLANANSFGSVTSPFTSPNPGALQLGGNQYFIPQPAPISIIGGVTHPSSIGNIGMVRGNFNQSPSRYVSSSNTNNNQLGSPIRCNDTHSGEPMHYSPIHATSTSYGPSPSYGGYGQSISSLQHSPGNMYLPSYLLGLDQHYQSFHQSGLSGPPPSPGVGTSGGRVVNPRSFMNSPGSYKRNVTFDKPTFPETENIAESDVPPPKPKGPPIHGFGSSEGSSTKEFLESPLMKESYSPNDETRNSGDSPIQNSSYIQTFDTPTSSSSTNRKCWVTIFGFPAGASSFIVSNFSTLGKILEVKCTPGSNWLHIQFSNPIEARRALNRNGKVLGRSIMVGVIPSDPAVIEEADKASFSSSSSEHTQQQSGPATSSTSILKERNTASDSLKSRIRPLASGSGYMPQGAGSSAIRNVVSPTSLSRMPAIARESLEVERNPGRTLLPTASTGIFTKAMEFVFGW